MKNEIYENYAKRMFDGGFFKVIEAAHFLGVSRATVYNLINEGELCFAKFGSSTRIPRSALIDYATKNLKGGWKHG